MDNKKTLQEIKDSQSNLGRRLSSYHLSISNIISWWVMHEIERKG